MTRLLKLLPSLILAALVLLVLQAEPPLAPEAQAGGSAKAPCEEYIAEIYYVPEHMGPTYVLAPVLSDCPFAEFVVEISPEQIPTEYELKLVWIDPQTGLPRDDTYPMHFEIGFLDPTDFGPLYGDREVPIFTDDELLPEPFTATHGLTVWMPPGRHVGVDLTPGQTLPSLDLISGTEMAGVLSFVTEKSTTSTPPVILDQHLPVDSPTPTMSTTEEIIIEIEIPYTATTIPEREVITVELAVSAKSDDKGDSLKVVIVDPEGLPEPLPGPTTVTTTYSTLGWGIKPTSGLPSFVPTVPVAPMETVTVGQRYWLVVKVEGSWSLGMDTSQGGQGIPDQRVWRRDYDGTVEELPADLAFRIIGAVTSTAAVEDVFGPATSLRMRVSPSPFTGRTQISFAGDGTEAQVGIYDLRGRAVREMRVPMSGDRGAVSWDGRDGTGRPLCAGSYLVRIRTDAGRVSSQKVTLLR